MPNQALSHNIIRYEIIGFILIALLNWVDEIYCLPSLIFGGKYVPNFHEAAIENFIVLLVAIPVISLTRKMVNRLHYLEEFLRVCAWCKKINHDDKWMPLEQYFEQRFDTMTSHGICPECFNKMQNP